LSYLYVRHEAVTINAWHEKFVTKPCVSPQVFYGSRRKNALRSWV
jgi:hypothetical protein